MELNRGQHPHAKKGGEWDTQLKRFISPGPETWGNPSRTYGGASEIERTRWEEKFGDAGDAEGFNPIAWVEVKGGQDAAAHARIKNLERIAKQSEERAHESTSKLKAAGLAAIAANGMLPRSREKVDTSAILNALSPSTPPAMSRVRMLPDSVRTMAKERYNIETIDQVCRVASHTVQRTSALLSVSLRLSTHTEFPTSLLVLCCRPRLFAYGPFHSAQRTREGA